MGEDVSLVTLPIGISGMRQVQQHISQLQMLGNH